MKRISLLLMLVLMMCLQLYPQAAQKRLSFDVASVKRTDPKTPRSQIVWRGGPGTSSPGRFTMPRASLAQMIARAYDVWPDQVTGPDWIANADAYAYSLAATMPANTTEEQFRAMLQNLLAERFHLRLHHVTQSRPGYELVVAEGGPKIKEWSQPNSGAAFKPGVDSNGFPKLDPGFGPGAAIVVVARSSQVAPVRMTRRETMAMFCRELGSNINISEGRPYDEAPPRVVDNTGLKGVYEFNLEFGGVLKSARRVAPPSDADSRPVDSSAPSPDIFAALETQLGLKLRKLKSVSVDVLVVDSADKAPVEN
jgi:uncharacterized protein (TIGR03435 family)